ncbi:MAG: acyl carrier protein [Acidobacteria bacterium]|nr:acyl carrier protein [Acidobacteriota bacterium]
MPDAAEIMNQLRTFICTDLVRNPAYPLRNDEPLVTGGLIDSFSIAQIGVFIEQKLGVYVPDTELTVENMDTLERMAALVQATAARGR